MDKYKTSKEEVFVIGGGEIYSALLPYCKNLYLTKRLDKKEIIQLIAKLKCFYLNSTRNKMGEFFMEDIVYEEEEYRWMH